LPAKAGAAHPTMRAMASDLRTTNGADARAARSRFPSS
jgi:hypothetical protein